MALTSADKERFNYLLRHIEDVALMEVERHDGTRAAVICVHHLEGEEHIMMPMAELTSSERYRVPDGATAEGPDVAH